MITHNTLFINSPNHSVAISYFVFLVFCRSYQLHINSPNKCPLWIKRMNITMLKSIQESVIDWELLSPTTLCRLTIPHTYLIIPNIHDNGNSKWDSCPHTPNPNGLDSVCRNVQIGSRRDSLQRDVPNATVGMFHIKHTHRHKNQYGSHTPHYITKTIVVTHVIRQLLFRRRATHNKK